MARAVLTQAQRSARTRAELLRSAERLFFRSGYHDTSLAEVARDAGYSKGAVYATFQSKDGLFLALCEVVFQQRLEQVKALFELEPDRRLEALANQPPDPRADTWLLLCIEFWVHSARKPEQLAAFAAIYRRMREELAELASETPGPLGAERWAVVALALTNGLALERLVEPDGVPDDLMAASMGLLMGGAGTDSADPLHDRQDQR